MGIQQALFYKNAATRVNISTASANANRILPDPAAAQASLGVYADGFVKRSINGGAALNQYTWLLLGINTDYDVRLTTIAGTAPAGPALATWHNLGTDRVWTLSQAGGAVGSSSYSGTIEVRDAVSLVVLGSATFSWSATVSV